MRKIDDEAEQAYALHRELSPRYGEVAVGGAHMDSFFRAEGIRGLCSAVNRGLSVSEAVEAGNQRAKEAIQKWNARKGVDFTIKRWEDSERSRLFAVGLAIAEAAKPA